MSHPIPRGFQLAGVHCGIKRDHRNDIALVVAVRPAVAAAVFTQNKVFAAPVAVDRARTPSDRMRAVIVNSGNANACTGDRGLADAIRMCQLTAEACNVSADEVLVMSTGIIGVHLPMERIAAGIRAAANSLGKGSKNLDAAAEGMMTTDLVPKIASREFTCGDNTFQITGIAKGSGMIGPCMATMLSTILTDAPLSPDQAQAILSAVVAETFNCVSVDGHTSTNDTVILMASGTQGSLSDESARAFEEALREVATELSRAIANDGEGATHLIEIRVRGCATRGDAVQIARTIANSPLVKTAITGGDPNWGRIVSAAGYAGPKFNPATVNLSLNGVRIYTAGSPVDFDPQALSQSITSHRETTIEIEFREGSAAARFWTSDLTKDYIRINAEYHT